MRELRQKQKIKRRLYSTPVLVILLVIALLAIRSTWSIIGKYRESAGYVDDLRQKSIDLNAREAELKANIARLGTDAGIETEIKEKFNVSREGEQVAIIVDKDGHSTSTSTTTDPWWKRLWDSIMGH